MNQYHAQAGTISMTPKIDEPMKLSPFGPKPTPKKVQVSHKHYVSPSHHLGNDNSLTYSSSYCEKNDESFNSSSSSGILAVKNNSYSGTDTNRDRENETGAHSITFELDSSDNHDCIQHHNPTPQRRQRARNVTAAALSSSSSASATTTTSFLSPASPPKLCLGLSDFVDDALTRVADAMFDGMRCGMDDTCHRWTYVPGEDTP